jgi:hypothetical protein
LDYNFGRKRPNNQPSQVCINWPTAGLEERKKCENEQFTDT